MALVVEYDMLDRTITKEFVVSELDFRPVEQGSVVEGIIHKSGNGYAKGDRIIFKPNYIANITQYVEPLIEFEDGDIINAAFNDYIRIKGEWSIIDTSFTDEEMREVLKGHPERLERKSGSST